MQVHDPAPFCSRQMALLPQGDGEHTFTGSLYMGGATDYSFYVNKELKKKHTKRVYIYKIR